MTPASTPGRGIWPHLPIRTPCGWRGVGREEKEYGALRGGEMRRKGRARGTIPSEIACGLAATASARRRQKAAPPRGAPAKFRSIALGTGRALGESPALAPFANAVTIIFQEKSRYWRYVWLNGASICTHANGRIRLPRLLFDRCLA